MGKIIKKFTVLDLFAGAGGLSKGFEDAGYEIAVATDFDKWSTETLKLNHPNTKVVLADITETDPRDLIAPLQEVDLVVGGPPCQGFSMLGKRLKDDPRNQLMFEYFRYIKELRPKVFVMENVPQLLKSELFDEFLKEITEIGYEVEYKVLLAADYGVPEKRQRAIVIGSRIGKITHPSPTHIDPIKKELLQSNLEAWATVRSAIGDLSFNPDGHNLHVGRNPTDLSMKRYKSVPIGGNRFDLPLELLPNCWIKKKTGSTDVFGRLWWDKPSVTIRTEFFKPEKGRYLHPEAHRPITLREAARIQTFPDDYQFVGSNTQIAKQIGNAVPCRLGQVIAQHIKTQLIELSGAEQSALQDMPLRLDHGLLQPVLSSDL